MTEDPRVNICDALSVAVTHLGYATEERTSAPYRGRPRTLEALLETLMAWFIANPTASFETTANLPENYIGDEDLSKKAKRAA